MILIFSCSIVIYTINDNYTLPFSTCPSLSLFRARDVTKMGYFKSEKLADFLFKIHVCMACPQDPAMFVIINSSSTDVSNRFIRARSLTRIL